MPQRRSAGATHAVDLRSRGLVARRLVVDAELDLELHDPRAVDLDDGEHEAVGPHLVADLGSASELAEYHWAFCWRGLAANTEKANADKEG